MIEWRTWLSGPDVLLGGAVLAAALLIVLPGLMAWRAYRARNPVPRLLRRLGAASVRDRVIPDGVGGSLQVDYLVLMRGGILVLDVKQYRGALFGAEAAPLWTQVVNACSYKFDNPLPHNRLRTQAVAQLLPQVPVRGCVVFTPDGQFPRGMPTGVSMLNDLAAHLEGFAGTEDVPVAYREAWEKLVAEVS